MKAHWGKLVGGFVGILAGAAVVSWAFDNANLVTGFIGGALGGAPGAAIGERITRAIRERREDRAG